VNVDEVPDANDELKRLGVPRVPAVAVGDKVVHGWNPAAYAALVGVDYTPVVTLSPAVLARRLDTILAAAEAVMRALPESRMEWTPPERNRPLADLGYHVFRLSLGFVEGVDRATFPETVHTETAPPDLRTGEAIARYGALVRARLSGWFAGAGADEFERIVETYWGPVIAHDLLERTTWHAAQHVRQLYILTARINIAPPVPEPTSAYEGLPMPAAIW